MAQQRTRASRQRVSNEHGYRIESVFGGELAFVRPDGTKVPAAGPAGTPLPDYGFARLVQRHSEHGLHIDALTALPRWDGDRVDYDAVVHARASRRPAPAPA